MSSSKLFLSSPHLSDEGFEFDFILQAFDSNWIAPLGANVDAFELDMAKFLGVNDAVALNTGTAAIHLALKCLNIQQGDVVFCQSLTFCASANPIAYEKALPVFIDSESDTWNMSPDALESALQTYSALHKKPKAVIVVHLYGIAANIGKLQSICKKYDVPLIEDAAESLGTKVGDHYTGSFGDYGILSFNGNKIITSSGGGMLLCNTLDAAQHAKKARFWATQSRESQRHYEHTEIGYNYRMSNILAGIGRGQLKVLEQRIIKKREIFNHYQQAFQKMKDITMMPFDLYASYQNCWLSTIQLMDHSTIRPTHIMDALEKENIESRPLWKPMHLQPVFANCAYFDNGGVAERLFKNGVCLPSDTKMTDAQLHNVITIIKGLWK